MDDNNSTNDTNDQSVDPTVVPADTQATDVASEPAKEDVQVPAEPNEEVPLVSEGPTVENTTAQSTDDINAPVVTPLSDPNSSASQSAPAGVDQQGRQLYDAKCSTCGKDIQVPFQPAEGRPVYCREDFIKMKNGQQ